MPLFVYLPNTRIDIESFNAAHPWILEDAVQKLGQDGRPKFLPRRFCTEYQAMHSRHVSGGTVREDKSLRRMQYFLAATEQ